MRLSYPVTFLLPDGEKTLEVGAGEYLWHAAELAGLRLPSRCRVGWCLTCAARLETGEVDNSSARRYFEADRQAGFILPCTARPRSPLRLRTHQEEAMRQHRLALGLPAPLG